MTIGSGDGDACMCSAACAHAHLPSHINRSPQSLQVREFAKIIIVL